MQFTLHKKRITYAYSNANSGRGQRSWFNCWGATLYALGAIKSLEWISGTQMEQWLESNTRPIGKPRQPGDIVVFKMYGRWLEHTAVYLGHGMYFHKRGANNAQITTLAGVRRTYSGERTFRRVTV